MDNYVIAETDTFVEKIQTPAFKNIYKKITGYIYPQLRENPFFGPNIKKLKGKYKELYRYRIGDNQLFYKINNEQIIVF